MFRNRATGFFSTIFAWLGLAARAPIAIFAGLFGVAVIAFGIHLGIDSVRLGIFQGWETRDWVKADETDVSAATIRWHRIWGLGSSYEELYAPYRYKIDGTWHGGKNFSAMGVLIADVETVYEVRDRLGSFDAWYDPENPSDAVLKKGITFDGTTKSAMKHIAVGSIVLLTALAYMRNKEKLLRRFFPRWVENYEKMPRINMIQRRLRRFFPRWVKDDRDPFRPGE
jgi:hypothetical protein